MFAFKVLREPPAASAPLSGSFAPQLSLNAILDGPPSVAYGSEFADSDGPKAGNV